MGHSFRRQIAASPQYMLDVYERQREDGTRPLKDNPTLEEVHEAIAYHEPGSVLEIGCGWGRLTSPLNDLMGGIVEGCDYLPEMLELCDGTFDVFQWNCVTNEPPTTRQWDVTFTRGVFLYLVGDEVHESSMNHILAVTRKKAIFWEWPETIDEMTRAVQDPRIEYRIQRHVDE